MNRFLINNCYSQHADTVAQGTNSKSFHIPCATAPQIVANRYTTSRTRMKILLSIIIISLLGCNNNTSRYLVANIDGREWYAKGWYLVEHKLIEYPNIFNHDFYDLMASTKTKDGIVSLKIGFLSFDSCTYEISINENQAVMVFYDSAKTNRRHYSSYASSGRMYIKKNECAPSDSLVEGRFSVSLINTLTKRDTIRVTNGFFRALKRK